MAYKRRGPRQMRCVGCKQVLTTPHKALHDTQVRGSITFGRHTRRPQYWCQPCWHENVRSYEESHQRSLDESVALYAEIGGISVDEARAQLAAKNEGYRGGG